MKCPILLDSLFAVVLAVPSDLITVKLAAKCLKVSVSVPTLLSEAPLPAANSNKWRRTTMEVCVLPDPELPEIMMACKNKKPLNGVFSCLGLP